MRTKDDILQQSLRAKRDFQNIVIPFLLANGVKKETIPLIVPRIEYDIDYRNFTVMVVPNGTPLSKTDEVVWQLWSLLPGTVDERTLFLQTYIVDGRVSSIGVVPANFLATTMKIRHDLVSRKEKSMERGVFFDRIFFKDIFSKAVRATCEKYLFYPKTLDASNQVF